MALADPGWCVPEHTRRFSFALGGSRLRPPINPTLTDRGADVMLTPLTYGIFLMTSIVGIVVTILAAEKIYNRIKRRTAGETVRRMMM
jgi:hypothetical protein